MISSNIIGMSVFPQGEKPLPSCIEDVTISRNKVLDIQSEDVQTIEGLIDFDGVDDAVSFNDGIFNMTSSGFIQFNLYLKKESGYSTANNGDTIIVFALNSSYNRNSIVRLYDDKIIFIIPDNIGGWNRYYYSLAGLSNKILNIKFNWSSYLYSILTINDAAVIPTLDTLGGQLTGETNFRIGFIPSAGYIDDVYIWNMNINDAHFFTGIPDGNLDSAWVDTIGDIDGFVLGSPSIASLSESTYFVNDVIGTDIRDVYYGQYLDETSGQIDFNSVVGTFDYINPSTGILVEGISIPIDGLYTIPVNGVCDIGVYPRTETSPGVYAYTYFYPVCERAGTVLHDIMQNSKHISVDSPIWAESLYGSDYLNQQGFIDKDDNDAYTQVIVEGVLDFSNTYFNSVIFPSQFDVTGTKTVSFSMYLETDTFTVDEPLFTFGDSNSDFLSAKLSGNNLDIIVTSSTSNINKSVDITGLDSQQLDIEIIKGTGTITSVSINGVLQSIIDLAEGYNSFSYSMLGFNSIGSYFLDQAYIWDLNVNSEHSYLGYPNADTLAAWVDNIGSNDVVVLTSNPATPPVTLTTIREYKSLVNGNYVTLDDSTLVPLAQWQ